MDRVSGEHGHVAVIRADSGSVELRDASKFGQWGGASRSAEQHRLDERPGDMQIGLFAGGGEILR